MDKQLSSLIEFLQQGKFVAECPSCGETFKLSATPLFDANNFTPEARELLDEKKAEIRERKALLKNLAGNTRARIENTTKTVNIGFILERLAPALAGFRFDKNDCRSLFDPIDYVIFEGLNKTGKVQRIIFTDIKTGDARLKKMQKAIKEAVTNKKIELKTY